VRRLLIELLLLLGCASANALSADAYIVEDLNGEVIMEQNADSVRSIASITKLFIAQASEKLDQDELITIEKDDMQLGRMRSTPLKVGKSYTRRQLTELALISSDNVAAIALGRSVPFNTTALATLVEASGLNAANQSTARQLAAAARELYNTEVAATSTKTSTEIGNRHSTNPLLTREGWEFYLSKTGFIDASGGCLVVITQMGGKIVTVVILGAKNTKERWLDLIELRRRMGDTDFYVPIKVVKVIKKTKKTKKVRKT